MNKRIKLLVVLFLIGQSCTHHKMGIKSIHSSFIPITDNEIIDGDIVQLRPPGKKPLVSFDYAIKNLLRGKEDYEILENFISNILKRYGKSSIEIVELLESETNQQTEKHKHCLMDIVAKDTEGRYCLIEIERNKKENFFHKALYSTSVSIADGLKSNDDYDQIKKVYHISLLYFTPNKKYNKNMTALTHVKMGFKDINLNNIELYLKGNQYGNPVKATDVHPEYFILTIPTDKPYQDQGLNDELGDWLYILNNDELPPNPHLPSSCIEKIKNKLTYVKMSDEYKVNYKAYIERKIIKNNALKRSRAEGKAEGKIEIARNLLSLKIDLETIQKSTGLPKKEIEEDFPMSISNKRQRTHG